VITVNIMPALGKSQCHIIFASGAKIIARHAGDLGVLSLLYGPGEMYFVTREIGWTGTNFEGLRMARPVWVGADMIAYLSGNAAITPRERSLLISQNANRPGRPASQLLLTALLRGCELQPFRSDDPLGRVHGEPAAVSGFVLKFPDSRPRQILGVRDDGLPRMTEEAIQHVMDFLKV
jgi:hypothetical protein